MDSIRIGRASLPVKDYDCSAERDGLGYLPKERPVLWLYVNVTDRCDGACPFCVAGAGAQGRSVVDPTRFFKVLEEILPHLAGISFTGGEPMLELSVLDELIPGTAERLPGPLELDLVTNGTNLDRLAAAPWLPLLAEVHISRHAAADDVNRHLMGFDGTDAARLRAFVSGLPDPGLVVLNCVLQKGGVETMEGVASYLDFAIRTGVRNTSFITMFPANGYCRDHHVSGADFPVMDQEETARWNRTHPGRRFSIWNRQRDHEFCRCCSGSYRGDGGRTRFYFRCPGPAPAPAYCRQLVYTAENILQDGFGVGRLRLL